MVQVTYAKTTKILNYNTALHWFFKIYFILGRVITLQLKKSYYFTQPNQITFFKYKHTSEIYIFLSICTVGKLNTIGKYKQLYLQVQFTSLYLHQKEWKTKSYLSMNAFFQGLLLELNKHPPPPPPSATSNNQHAINLNRLPSFQGHLIAFTLFFTGLHISLKNSSDWFKKS